MERLHAILEKFAASGWDLIDGPSRKYLAGEENTVELLNAICQANVECGDDGCEFDPLYIEAIDILRGKLAAETEYHTATKCVQCGYTPKNGEPRVLPIIQSTTFKYDTSSAMGKLFDLEADGYFYSRLQNPTNDHVAARIAAREGGTAAML